MPCLHGFITRSRLLVTVMEPWGSCVVCGRDRRCCARTTNSLFSTAMRLFTGCLAATLLCSIPVAAQDAASTSIEAARERLRFIEGSYRGSSGVVGDTTTTVWRFRPILGGKYFELQAVRDVEFRVTIGFDSTSRRYRMSLLDAGTGAFDVYDGDFEANGALILQNPNFWRVSFARTTVGISWRFEHSRDQGATWQGRPAVELKRMRVMEHP